jgi:tetratricopeptide (TPR) repeat protein
VKVSGRIGVSLLTILFLAVSFSYAQNVAKQHLTKGMDYAVQGKFREAKEEFIKALEVDPFYETAKESLQVIEDVNDKKIESKAAIHLFKGAAHVTNYQLDEAITHSYEAIRINPKYAMAYCFRGFAYYNKEQYDKAIRAYTRAIRLDSRLATAYFGRGRTYSRGKCQYDRAISDYTKAIEINPRFAMAYCFRGFAYARNYQYNKAISDFTKAIEINPRYGEAYANRGYTYRSKGEYDKAQEDFRKAQSLGHQVSQGFLATLRKALGSMDKIDFPRELLVAVILVIAATGLVLVLIAYLAIAYDMKRKEILEPTGRKTGLLYWLLRGKIERTESLKKLGPQLPLSSSPSEDLISKFKESTGVMCLAFDEHIAGCIFGVKGLGYSTRKATNIMKGNIGSIDFVTFDYCYSGEKETDPDIFWGTAILFQSDQLSLPCFKWRSTARPSHSMEFLPKTPPRTKEEAGRKQCKTCGNWDVRWAMIEDGGLGDWCPHCKKSFCKMNEEKVLKLSKVMSYAYYPKWKALASGTQLLLELGEQVAAEKYHEFMDEALIIFHQFQSTSQSLEENV